MLAWQSLKVNRGSSAYQDAYYAHPYAPPDGAQGPPSSSVGTAYSTQGNYSTHPGTDPTQGISMLMNMSQGRPTSQRKWWQSEPLSPGRLRESEPLHSASRTATPNVFVVQQSEPQHYTQLPQGSTVHHAPEPYDGGNATTQQHQQQQGLQGHYGDMSRGAIANHINHELSLAMGAYQEEIRAECRALVDTRLSDVDKQVEELTLTVKSLIGTVETLSAKVHRAQPPKGHDDATMRQLADVRKELGSVSKRLKDVEAGVQDGRQPQQPQGGGVVGTVDGEAAAARKSTKGARPSSTVPSAPPRRTSRDLMLTAVQLQQKTHERSVAPDSDMHEENDEENGDEVFSCDNAITPTAPAEGPPALKPVTAVAVKAAVKAVAPMQASVPKQHPTALVGGMANAVGGDEANNAGLFPVGGYDSDNELSRSAAMTAQDEKRKKFVNRSATKGEAASSEDEELLGVSRGSASMNASRDRDRKPVRASSVERKGQSKSALATVDKPKTEKPAARAPSPGSAKSAAAKGHKVPSSVKHAPEATLVTSKQPVSAKTQNTVVVKSGSIATAQPTPVRSATTKAAVKEQGTRQTRAVDAPSVESPTKEEKDDDGIPADQSKAFTAVAKLVKQATSDFIADDSNSAPSSEKSGSETEETSGLAAKAAKAVNRVSRAVERANAKSPIKKSPSPKRTAPTGQPASKPADISTPVPAKAAPVNIQGKGSPVASPAAAPAPQVAAQPANAAVRAHPAGPSSTTKAAVKEQGTRQTRAVDAPSVESPTKEEKDDDEIPADQSKAFTAVAKLVKQATSDFIADDSNSAPSSEKSGSETEETSGLAAKAAKAVNRVSRAVERANAKSPIKKSPSPKRTATPKGTAAAGQPASKPADTSTPVPAKAAKAEPVNIQGKGSPAVSPAPAPAPQMAAQPAAKRTVAAGQPVSQPVTESAAPETQPVQQSGATSLRDKLKQRRKSAEMDESHAPSATPEAAPKVPTGDAPITDEDFFPSPTKESSPEAAPSTTQPKVAEAAPSTTQPKVAEAAPSATQPKVAEAAPSTTQPKVAEAAKVENSEPQSETVADAGEADGEEMPHVSPKKGAVPLRAQLRRRQSPSA